MARPSVIFSLQLLGAALVSGHKNAYCILPPLILSGSDMQYALLSSQNITIVLVPHAN